MNTYLFHEMGKSGMATMEYSAIQEFQRSSDESQLVLAAQKGDHEAFNELVLMHQDRVYNLAYRILGESDSADDITQDTFIIAFRNLPRFRNGSIRSWLFRIATNLCYDEYRQRKRRSTLSLDIDDGLEERFLPHNNWSVPQITPEQTYARHELEQVIQKALDGLEPNQRAVVVLVDLQDMDYQEAAQVLRIPIGTVKSRLARGRVRLRQLLDHLEI